MPDHTTDKVIDLREMKRRRDAERYRRLVLKTFADFEHADRRKMLDRKAEVQIAAREKL